MQFLYSFHGQLCPIIMSEVEALNANLSMLEGESWNCLFRMVLFLPANSDARQVCFSV